MGESSDWLAPSQSLFLVTKKNQIRKSVSNYNLTIIPKWDIYLNQQIYEKAIIYSSKFLKLQGGSNITESAFL